MDVIKYSTLILIFLISNACSSSKKDDPSPDIHETPLKQKQTNEEGTSFLETAEPFYPLKETVEDIQAQINDLHSRVIEYEMRVSTPNFNTEVLKMIKIPQLNHEINLTNGTLIQGTIIQENMNQIIVQTQIGQLTIDKGNIESIKEIAPASAKIIFDGDADEKILPESRIFTGTVTNVGLHRGDFVRIIYNLWGGETDLIASDSTFIDGTQIVYSSGVITDTCLQPGQTAEFFLQVRTPSDANVQYITRDIQWDSFE